MKMTNYISSTQNRSPIVPLVEGGIAALITGPYLTSMIDPSRNAYLHSQSPPAAYGCWLAAGICWGIGLATALSHADEIRKERTISQESVKKTRRPSACPEYEWLQGTEMQEKLFNARKGEEMNFMRRNLYRI